MMIERTYNGDIPVIAESQFFLERPRINTLLEKAIKSPIVTVTAGAGYGKSRSVYAFVRNYPARTTWVQFSEADNNSDHFWENYVNAIGVISRNSMAKLTELEFPLTERQFNRYLSVPRGETIPMEKYFIIYDDVHLIHNRSVISFLERWLSSSFPNITLVLISRLPLLGGVGGEAMLDLSKPESKGRVTHITEEDLRFNRDETSEYLRLLGVHPSMQMVSDIYHDTEGWAIAMNLAGLSVRNSTNAYVPRALRSNIYKLVEGEIISGLSSEFKKFLVKLSLIDHLVPDLLRTIAGAGGYSLIDGLEQLGSFVQYDAYRNTYRIHNLLLDYLKERQYELSDTEKREVWEKAAHWCLRNNFKQDAMSYYERCGDYYRLLDVVNMYPLLLPKQVSSTLFAIMETAPKRIYEEVPQAWVTWFRLLLNLEMFERADKELRVVIADIESLPEINTQEARTLAGCYIAMGFITYISAIYTRDYSCVRYFERAHHYFTLCGYTPLPPISVMNVGSYTCRVASTDPGEMERHNEALERFTAYLSSALNGCGCGLDDLAWGELAFFRNNISDADEHFQKVVVKARKNNQYETESRALLFLLRINLCRGNSAAIPTLLQQIEDQKHYAQFTNYAIYRDIAYGWLYVQTGEPEKIAGWLQSSFEESDLNSIVYGLEILIKARCQFAKKRYPAALADLQSRDNKYGVFSLLLGKLEIKVLEAVCRYRMNDNQGAFRDLEAAWELAKNNDLLMPFAERGKDMRALAGAAIKDGSLAIPRDTLEKIRRVAALYAKNVLAASVKPESKTADRTGKGCSGAVISPRERDVLAGLSQGLTREEIARVLSISINTVKSVTRSIFSKLGAVNRADAVRIATELGLL